MYVFNYQNGGREEAVPSLSPRLFGAFFSVVLLFFVVVVLFLFFLIGHFPRGEDSDCNPCGGEKWRGRN